MYTFNSCILSSTTTALSTSWQGRFYVHICTYIDIYFLILNTTAICVTAHDYSDCENRPNRLTQCRTQFKSPRVKVLCVLYLHVLYLYVPFTFK